MKRFVVSYVGRSKAEVSLAKIAPENRSVRGSTLFLRPKTTNVLTEEELGLLQKKAPGVYRYLVVHHEVKPKSEANLKVEEKPNVEAPKEKASKEAKSKKGKGKPTSG